MDIRHKIIWFDCIAAVSVGLIVLLLSPMVSEIYGMSERVIVFIALANLLYGAYSFSLAIHKKRSLKRLHFLIYGNLFWALICAVVVVLHLNTASIIGLSFIVCEALFVILLAHLEWKYRFDLISGEDSALQVNKING